MGSQSLTFVLSSKLRPLYQICFWWHVCYVGWDVNVTCAAWTLSGFQNLGTDLAWCSLVDDNNFSMVLQASGLNMEQGVKCSWWKEHINVLLCPSVRNRLSSQSDQFKSSLPSVRVIHNLWTRCDHARGPWRSNVYDPRWYNVCVVQICMIRSFKSWQAYHALAEKQACIHWKHHKSMTVMLHGKCKLQHWSNVN